MVFQATLAQNLTKTMVLGTSVLENLTKTMVLDTLRPLSRHAHSRDTPTLETRPFSRHAHSRDTPIFETCPFSKHAHSRNTPILEQEGKCLSPLKHILPNTTSSGGQPYPTRHRQCKPRQHTHIVFWCAYEGSIICNKPATKQTIHDTTLALTSLEQCETLAPRGTGLCT